MKLPLIQKVFIMITLFGIIFADINCPKQFPFEAYRITTAKEHLKAQTLLDLSPEEFKVQNEHIKDCARRSLSFDCRVHEITYALATMEKQQKSGITNGDLIEPAFSPELKNYAGNVRDYMATTRKFTPVFEDEKIFLNGKLAYYQNDATNFAKLHALHAHAEHNEAKEKRLVTDEHHGIKFTSTNGDTGALKQFGEYEKLMEYLKGQANCRFDVDSCNKQFKYYINKLAEIHFNIRNLTFLKTSIVGVEGADSKIVINDGEDGKGNYLHTIADAKIKTAAELKQHLGEHEHDTHTITHKYVNEEKRPFVLIQELNSLADNWKKLYSYVTKLFWLERDYLDRLIDSTEKANAAHAQKQRKDEFYKLYKAATKFINDHHEEVAGYLEGLTLFDDENYYFEYSAGNENVIDKVYTCCCASKPFVFTQRLEDIYYDYLGRGSTIPAQINAAFMTADITDVDVEDSTLRAMDEENYLAIHDTKEFNGQI